MGCISTILSYCYRASTQFRSQSFDIRLENEPRVVTLIRQNLVLIQKGDIFLPSLQKPPILLRYYLLPSQIKIDRD